MKITIEIENEEEFKRAEHAIKYLKCSEFILTNKKQKIIDFLDYTEKDAVHVDKIEIPSREERNAR